MSWYIPHPIQLTMKIWRIVSQNCILIFFSGMVKKVLDKEKGDKVLTPPPPTHTLSFVYEPAFTYLCIKSHQYIERNSGFPDNPQASYLDNYLRSILHMQQVLMCGTIWRHYNHDFISCDLIGQKFWNDLTLGNWIFMYIWIVLSY